MFLDLLFFSFRQHLLPILLPVQKNILFDILVRVEYIRAVLYMLYVASRTPQGLLEELVRQAEKRGGLEHKGETS